MLASRVTRTADGQRDHGRMRLEHETGVRQREADGVEQLEETLREEQPEEEADHRGDHSDDERFDDDGAEDLAVGRTDGSQRRELARALRDRDRERVRDHERPHEQRDPGEGEQERAEERDEVVRVRCIVLRLLAPRQHLSCRWEDCLDLVHELGVRDVGLGRDGDLVQLTGLLEETLRSREVEAGERRAANRETRAELDDAGHAHLFDRAFRLDTDLLADLEVLVAGGLLVDDDLVRTRPAALHQRQRIEDRVAVRDREPEVWRSARHDRLPVVTDELRRIRIDAALGLGDAGQRLNLRQQRVVERRWAEAVLIAQIDSRLAGDDRVGALPDVREDPVERLIDRVREDVRPADHRDPEDDRDGGERST